MEIHGLTRAIRAETEPEDRVAIMEMVWMVVLADGELHEYESQLMRRLAGLLCGRHRFRPCRQARACQAVAGWLIGPCSPRMIAIKTSALSLKEHLR